VTPPLGTRGPALAAERERSLLTINEERYSKRKKNGAAGTLKMRGSLDRSDTGEITLEIRPGQILYPGRPVQIQ